VKSVQTREVYCKLIGRKDAFANTPEGTYDRNIQSKYFVWVSASLVEHSWYTKHESL
jgi:hypothetical protein